MHIPQILRRSVEAELAARFMAVLEKEHGRSEALRLLENVIEQAAFEAGQAFAQGAPGAPCLAHFGEILERWREGNALEMADVRISREKISFKVIRCGYVEAYRRMGLDSDLAVRISCGRDAPFARGYSPRLRMARPCTIAEGAAACEFTFTWDEGPA